MPRVATWLLPTITLFGAIPDFACAQTAIAPDDPPFVRALSARSNYESLAIDLAADRGAFSADKTAERGLVTADIPDPTSPILQPVTVADAEARRRDEIETDRDSFTPATSVVGASRTVVESSWSFIDHRG